MNAPSPIPMRRLLLASGAAALAGCAARGDLAAPTLRMLEIDAAGPGSAFLPYAQGLARYLDERGLAARAVPTHGSIENLQRLRTATDRIGLVFLGTAFEAVSGQGAWTEGVAHADLRALFPMYETSFQLVARRGTGVSDLASVANRAVGVGPKGGPAESFFRGLLQAVGIDARLVNGTPAALAGDLVAGRIDALWQGASLPIPAIAQVTEATEAVVFGLTQAERTAMLGRFPFLSAATVEPGTYRGQSAPIETVAAWNFAMAHRGFPEGDAYWITRTVLSAADPASIHPSARPTRAANASRNTVVPFHDGARRFYRERGVVGRG